MQGITEHCSRVVWMFSPYKLSRILKRAFLTSALWRAYVLYAGVKILLILADSPQSRNDTHFKETQNAHICATITIYIIISQFLDEII